MSTTPFSEHELEGDEEAMTLSVRFAPSLDAARKQLCSQRPYQAEESSYHIVDDRRQGESPFISIVMRTQGKRMKAMAQALSALEKQGDKGFELLVCVHNMPERVDGVLAELERHSGLDGMWCLTEVQGGSPARPLNVANVFARGEYYVVHDDDDLALEDYVSAFRAGAATYPGSVLYSYVYAQSWRDSQEGPIASGDLELPYCRQVNQVDLLFQNAYPDIGVAFPRDVFLNAGLAFDETLDILDDWDFLLRAQNICGLHVLSKPTSIYRLWVTGETSHVRNDTAKWLATARAIQQKADSGYLILPPGSLSAFISRSTIGAPALYFDDTNGMAETKKLSPITSKMERDVLTASFEIDESKYPCISALRFDPSEGGHVMVNDVHIVAETSAGSVSFELGSMTHNGIDVTTADNVPSVVYLQNDPQLIMTFDEPCTVGRVDIVLHISTDMPDELIDKAISTVAQRKIDAALNSVAPVPEKPKKRGLFKRR